MKRKLWFYVQLSVIALCALYLLLRFGKYSEFDYAEISKYTGFEGSGHQRPHVGSPASPPWPTRAPDFDDDDKESKPKHKSGSGFSSPLRLDDDEDESADFTIPSGMQSVNLTILEEAMRMIPSILDPTNESVERLECPAINTTRYDYLKGTRYKRKHQYLIAVNLRQCIELLPRLLGSVMEVIDYLGAEQIVLSIVEGNSDDGTAEVLDLLRPHLKNMGVAHFIVHSKLNLMDGERIQKLAKLREIAVRPLAEWVNIRAKKGGIYDEIDQDEKDNEDPGGYYRKRDEESAEEESTEGAAEPEAESSKGSEYASASDDVADSDYVDDPKVKELDEKELAAQAAAEEEAAIAALDWAEDPIVLFLNDVTACAEDVLELLHQRIVTKADMTCAMDWEHRPYAAFYDVWVSRTMAGDLFFKMPGGSWDFTHKLFPTEPIARHRYLARRPFQVFSCWNGATAFTGVPLLKGEVNFRGSLDEECFQDAVQLFCKDMWFNGYGKIAVVPTINLGYKVGNAKRLKDEMGFVSMWAMYEHEEVEPMEVQWRGPPEEVLCMPDFHRQSWMPWNESLPLPGSLKAKEAAAASHV